MSKSKSTQHILTQAKEEEKKYDWIKAADLYEQALSIVGKPDSYVKGEIQERIGYCFHRAAFQVETNREFKKLMRLAVEAYNHTAETFEKVEEIKMRAMAKHCEAMTIYIKSWLAADLPAKREQLDECWSLEKEALQAFEEATDHMNIGKTCNNLMIILTDRLNIEWDADSREKIVEEALEYGEKAITVFSESQDKHQLAQAYTLAAFFYRNAAFIRGFKAERREECRKKALSYPEKAIEISEETGDAHLLGRSIVCLIGSRGDLLGTRSEKQHYERALQCGNLTKDKLLIADALLGLEYITGSSALTQEDPDKVREQYGKRDTYFEDAVRHYNVVAHDLGATLAYVWAIDAVEHRVGIEIDVKSKLLFLEKSVELGYKGLEHAYLSGSMGGTMFMKGVFSRALVYLAKFEADTDKKRALLEESSKLNEEKLSILKQASAASIVEPRENALAFTYYTLARSQAEQANIMEGKDKKMEMLETAISNMRIAREFMLKLVKSPWLHDAKLYLGNLGAMMMEMGKMLSQLYMLTNDINVLGDAAKAFEESIESSRKGGCPSSDVAEGYWHLAKVHDNMGNYRESARNFELASKKHTQAARKIPQLKDFYQDYASYLSAWSEIERAKNNHARKEFGQAKERYKKASDLHKSTKRWSFLSPNYLAWASLEEAEDLSRKDQLEEAKDLFQEAAKLFVYTQETIKDKLDEIEVPDEKTMAAELVEASSIRREYCLGRTALEEAKILDRKGDHIESSGRYGSAADRLEKISEVEPEQSRKELRPIIYLCRAWQKMMMAEAKASSTLYGEAAELFKQAKEHMLDQPTSLLALANSSFCKALEAGTEFEITRDATMYSTAKKHLEAAANYYLKAGFKTASEYTKATYRLFDAYIYTNKAQTETDPRKKAQYYQMAEKLLQASASSYTKAKHPEKSEEIQRLLESVKEERQLATSLTEVLHAPTITSTTSSFSTPNPTREKAVGLERFEHAVIEGHFTASQEVTVGGEVEVRLDLVNVAKEPGLLVRVDNMVPPGLEVAMSPSQYILENGILDMRGRRLEPLKVETVKLDLRPTKSGVFNLRPQVIYVDEVGKFKTCKPEPASVTVHSKLAFEFSTKAAEKAFDFLAISFAEDYMRRRLPLEKSGWRTLMQIVKHGKVSKSSVYGTGGRRGRAVAELERRGLVETRVFPGERGRGGKILKMRVSYEKETVKRHIDQQVMKIKEK